MAVADDIRNFETGEKPGDPTGFEQGWFSHVRARKVKGDNAKKKPFTRFWPGGRTAASPMVQDKLTAIADAVGWRTVDPTGDVVDVGDMILVWWCYFIKNSDPTKLAQAIKDAQTLRPWPAGFPGVADFEVGT